MSDARQRFSAVILRIVESSVLVYRLRVHLPDGSDAETDHETGAVACEALRLTVQQIVHRNPEAFE